MGIVARFQSGADDTLVTAYRRLDFAGSIAHVPRGAADFRFAFIIQAADTITFAIIAASGADTAALVVTISCEAA
ncbi:hypothetical protein [Rhodoblastus sp.]|uniref:hypothetical protein n=1 Tax=Rhodoblastus sp. TaxID=1962975 RepID=UPI003F960F82